MKSLTAAAVHTHTAIRTAGRSSVSLLGVIPTALMLVGMSMVWAGPLAAPAAAATTGSNTIVLPSSGWVKVTITGHDSDCSGTMGLESPTSQVLLSDYHSLPIGTSKTVGSFGAGTELLFYLEPTGICGGHELSSDPSWAQVSNPSSTEWVIGWEDLNPGTGDFDDLVVVVDLGALPTGCTPGDGQVAVFKNAHYGGMCVVRGAGSYSSPTATGLPDNSISSFWLGANVRLLACQDSGFRGLCRGYVASNSNLAGTVIGNDQISSFRVQKTLPSDSSWEPGNCTQYAADQMHKYTGVYPGWSGDAKQWKSNAAAAGWKVSGTPAVNTIIVLQPGTYTFKDSWSSGQYNVTDFPSGHVGWVQAVSGSGTWVKFSDWNWADQLGVVNTHWVVVSGGISFIYPNG